MTKDLCAKAVSQEWRLPLLRMDPAKLYSRYIGETESKFNKAMQISEKMSPLILWIDEIEKGVKKKAIPFTTLLQAVETQMADFHRELLVVFYLGCKNGKGMYL